MRVIYGRCLSRAAPMCAYVIVFLLGVAGIRTEIGWSAEHQPPPTSAEPNFSLVDESGASLTDLGVDPDIDPAQVGLDPTLIINEQDILQAVLRQSAAMRGLWWWYVGIGLGFLMLSAQIVRLAYHAPHVACRIEFFLAGLAVMFGVFAYSHWTAVDTVSEQQLLLITALQHAASQPTAPDILTVMTSTVQPASRGVLATIHVGLDLAVILGLGLVARILRYTPDAAD